MTATQASERRRVSPRYPLAYDRGRHFIYRAGIMRVSAFLFVRTARNALIRPRPKREDTLK